MGLFGRIKALAKLAGQTEESSPELGDLVEPGSVGEVSAMPAAGHPGGAAGLDQLQELGAAGLVDADTLALIESSMTNATSELERLHDSGVMSDEVYAQAMASMSAASSTAGSSISADELKLLQHGEPAPATVLAPSQPSGEAEARTRMTLEVHPASGPPYTAECTVAAAHPAAALTVGSFVRVRIDPADPQHVAIDWGEFGT